MEEIVRIQKSKGGKDVVSARELYDYLGFKKSQWARWSKKNIEQNPYSEEKKDWVGFDIESNGNQSKDYALTIDFAKRISMLARTEEGEKVRRYFIECEKVALNSQAVQHQIPQTLSQALMLAAQQAERIEAQDRIIKENEPKVKAAEIMLMSDDSITVAEFAKSIHRGPIKLYRAMREDKLLINSGNRHNLPFQRFIDAGYFTVREKSEVINNKVRLFHQTMITPKGQIYLANKYQP